MPLVARADSVLAVVDTQPGFVEHPAMGAAERTEATRTVERIAWWARLAAWLDVPALASEEEPQREGHTHARVKACQAPDAPVVPKKTFALTGVPQGAALAQRVPAAVQLDLDRAQALPVLVERGGVGAVGLLARTRLVLLGNELLDAGGGALVADGTDAAPPECRHSD